MGSWKRRRPWKDHGWRLHQSLITQRSWLDLHGFSALGSRGPQDIWRLMPPCRFATFTALLPTNTPTDPRS